MYVDEILNEVPDDVSDEDYDVIETAFLDFRRIFTKTLLPPHDCKAPSWYVIKDGQVILCEGYEKIPEFQGREHEIASMIENAVTN